MTEPREIDVEELAERLAEGVVVIDVQEADEYDSGHVPGALFVPLSELELPARGGIAVPPRLRLPQR